MNADDVAVLVRRRIESRYRRLLFVHEELARLNALARMEPAAKQPVKTEQPELAARSFEDFVFSRINFSVYKKIDIEEFRLLFIDGLFDYDNSFYQKAFEMDRDEVHKTIGFAYIKAGPFYLCKKMTPLLMSIMRSLHTSLDFAPLLGASEIPDKDDLEAAVKILDGFTIRHDDGMETKLFIPKADERNQNMQEKPLLCGTFYPLGKACTITLM